MSVSEADSWADLCCAVTGKGGLFESKSAERNVPRRWGVEVFTAGHPVRIALSQKLWLLPGHLGPLLPMDQQAKKGVAHWKGLQTLVIVRNRVGMYVGRRQEDAQSSRESMNCVLELPGLVIMGKVKNEGLPRAFGNQGSHGSGRNVTLPSNQNRPQSCWLKRRGWVEEGSGYTCRWQHICLS